MASGRKWRLYRKPGEGKGKEERTEGEEGDETVKKKRIMDGGNQKTKLTDIKRPTTDLLALCNVGDVKLKTTNKES